MTSNRHKSSTGFSLNRRALIRGLSTGGVLLGSSLAAAPGFAKGAPGLIKGPLGDREPSPLFPLGVHSGDPTARSVVLGTRLVDDPFATGTEFRGRPQLLRVQVALDPNMRKIVRQRAVIARPEFGYSVNATIGGLPSNRWYYYRFEAPKLGAVSRIGRTRTFPAWNDDVRGMRFTFASCQNYESGFYTAYRDMLLEDLAAELDGAPTLDFVVHCGDYIYENAGDSTPLIPERVHVGDEIFTVAEYRRRYAQYRLDPDLQAMHARVPFLVTWDDHEVDNNFAGDVAEEGAPFEGEEFLVRKDNALQVYREVMPMRPRNRVLRGRELRIYRGLRFGSLANLYILDTRQYRDDQAAEDGFGSTDPASVALEEALGEKLFDPRIAAPSATMLGTDQEVWLANNLTASRARWNVLAQGIMQMRWNLALLGQGVVSNIYNVDAWDGYLAAQARLLAMLDASGAENPVVLTGDIHSFWAGNLLENYDDPASRAVAAEFVCSGISSTFGGPQPQETDALVKATLAQNPHIAYFEGRFRGYCLCEVDDDRWVTSYRAVGQSPSNPGSLLAFPDSPVTTDARVALAAGFNDPRTPGRLTTL